MKTDLLHRVKQISNIFLVINVKKSSKSAHLILQSSFPSLQTTIERNTHALKFVPCLANFVYVRSTFSYFK
jgi:hypothetical protein